MKRKPYPTDLTDEQWQLVEPLIPKAKPGGRPREVDIREVMNAIIYVLRAGGAWRLLPHDFPPWPTVWTYYRNWRRDGTWKRIHGHLRAKLRKAKGRDESPSAGVIDTQTVKAAENKGPRGYDPAKQIVGRKRHLVVDTEGLVWAVEVQTADTQDRDGAKSVLERLKGVVPRLKKLWGDFAYTSIVEWVKRTFGWILEIVTKDREAKGFQVQPHRWIIERTFGWLIRYRRLARDYEDLPETSEALIYIAMTNLMLHRLAPG